MAASSCRPQSHFSEPNTSPVMHCEWIRTSVGLLGRSSPLTSATNSSVEVSERKPMMRNSPVSVGSRAPATRSTDLCAVFVLLKGISLSPIFVFSRFNKIRVRVYRSLERLQVLDEVGLLLFRQVCVQERVVVVDHIAERGETSVVIEATFLVRPQSLQRRRPVTLVRRTLGLKIVNADLLRRVHVPTGLAKDRWYVTRRTLRWSIEHGFPTRGR